MSEEVVRANEDFVKYKHETVVPRSLNEEHAHAKMKQRRSKKAVVEPDFGCDEKDPMYSIADVPADDVCNDDYRPTDTVGEEVDSSLEHVSSAMCAAESVKKQSTCQSVASSRRAMNKNLRLRTDRLKLEKPERRHMEQTVLGKELKSRSQCVVWNNRKTRAVLTTF